MKTIKPVEEKMNSETMKNCPHCGERILANAIKCKYCGQQLDGQATQTANNIFSYAQPVWHFVLLSILTFGIYQIYWFYRNWKNLKVHGNLDIRPGWRTVGLFVPIYGIVLAYRQFRDIKNLAKESGIEVIYAPSLVLLGLIFLGLLRRLPDPFSLLGSLSIWPMAVVQETLNAYWAKEQPELKKRTEFSGEQIALIIIGGIFWMLGLIGMFMTI